MRVLTVGNLEEGKALEIYSGREGALKRVHSLAWVMG